MMLFGLFGKQYPHQKTPKILMHDNPYETVMFDMGIFLYHTEKTIKIQLFTT